MHNQSVINSFVDKKVSSSMLQVSAPLLTLRQFADQISFSCTGVRRLIKEERLPAGLLIRVGGGLRFNFEVTQAVINGQLQILSAKEANAQGRFVSRAARADHAKRLSKEAAKAARAQAEVELNNSYK